MTLRPNSTVRLYNAPFDISYQHTRWFSTKTEQEAYFAQTLTPIKTNQEVQHVRENKGNVTLPYNRDAIVNCNYLRFANDNKPYFAFITKIVFLNPSACVVEFEIDVLQTYMFEMGFKQSFVEREHNPTNSVNTVPENFDLGFEYEVKDYRKGNGSDNILYLLISCTEQLSGDTSNTPQVSLGGVPNSLIYYMFIVKYKPNRVDTVITYINGESVLTNWFNIIDYMQTEENIGKVVGMHFLPFLPFQHTVSADSNSNLLITSPSLSALPNKFLTRVLDYSPREFTSVSYPNVLANLKTLGGITENKLLYYPYSYLSLIDNNGGSVDILPQYLSTTNVDIVGNTIVDAKYRATNKVVGYRNNASVSLENALIDNVSQDLPIINDFTATYLQGNKNTMVSSAVNSVIGGVVSAGIGIGVTAMGNPLGIAGIVGGAVSIGKTIYGVMSKQNDIKNIPDNISKQASSSLLNISENMFHPQILVKQISKEKIDIIQSYLKAYGWATNRIKVPNLRTRQHFNYVQTVGCNVTGAIPKDDLNKIKEIFDTGVTLWHTNDMFNYGLQNGDR